MGTHKSSICSFYKVIFHRKTSILGYPRDGNPLWIIINHDVSHTLTIICHILTVYQTYQPCINHILSLDSPFINHILSILGHPLGWNPPYSSQNLAQTAMAPDPVAAILAAPHAFARLELPVAPVELATVRSHYRRGSSAPGRGGRGGCDLPLLVDDYLVDYITQYQYQYIYRG